jgi:cyanate permease
MTATETVPAFSALVLFIFACNAGGQGLLPAFAADSFGVRYFAAIYGVMLTAWSCADFLGPGLLSPLASNGTGATQALYLLGALLLLATATPLLVRPGRMKPPAERAETSFS